MPLANSLFCDPVAVELRFHGDLRVRGPVRVKTSIESPNSGADKLALVPGLALRRRGHRLRLKHHGQPPIAALRPAGFPHMGAKSSDRWLTMVLQAQTMS